MLLNIWLIVFLLWTIFLIKFLIEKGQNIRTLRMVIGLAFIGYLVLIMYLLL